MGVGRQRIGLRIAARVVAGTAAEGASRSWSNGSAVAARVWYTRPAAAGFGHRRQQLRACEEARRRPRPRTEGRISEAC